MSHRAFSRFRLISIALFVFGLVSVAVAFNATSAQEAKSAERIIRRLPIEKDEPIEITDVKVNGQTVSLNKKFTAADDWLNTLTISIKNRSPKRILFASIQLQFPRPPGSPDKMSVDDMFYGNWALQLNPPTSEERLVGLPVGETVDIRLSVQQYVDLRNFLTGTKYPSSIENVDLSIGRIIFEDDTMWYAGSISVRDAKKPGSWISSRYANSRSWDNANP